MSFKRLFNQISEHAAEAVLSIYGVALLAQIALQYGAV